MSAELSDAQTTALATLSLLEIRLRRIEFLLTGSSNHDGQPMAAPNLLHPGSSRETIAGRVQQLQNSLDSLRKLKGPSGDVVRDIEDLHTLIPEVFDKSSPSPSTSLSEQTTHIFANTSLYTETASRLSSLQTLSVPPADLSVQLADLRPRINIASSKQEQLEAQARELRERSARCLEWWVKFGVVGMSEIWSNWEARIKEVERETARIERVRSQKEGYI